MKWNSKVLIAVCLLASNVAFGTNSRILDGTAITVGSPSNLLTLPQTTDTAVARATTDTLTNKTISGASNTLTNISAASITSGTLGVANGGTGAVTLTTNGMLYGNGTSAVGVTAAGSQYQSFQAGASGVPTVGAVQLNQSAAVSGALAVSNGGTGLTSITAGNLIVGNGTSAANLIAPGTSGNVLTSNGSTWTSVTPSVTTPSLNGGSAAPQSVTAAGGISLTSISYTNFVWVIGSPGAVTVTATPSITACTLDGQQLFVIGTDNTKTVTLQDAGTLTSSGLRLNGQWVGAKYSQLHMSCNQATSEWFEVSRY